MSRLSSLSLILVLAVAIQMAFAANPLQLAGKCKYNLKLTLLAANGTLVGTPDKSCLTTLSNITAVHLFPNGTQKFIDELSSRLYQKSDAAGVSFNFAADDIANVAKLDASSCVDLDKGKVGATEYKHLCRFRVDDSEAIATLVTATHEGGSFLVNSTGNDLQIPYAPIAAGYPVDVVTACGNQSSHIVDQNQTLSLQISGVTQASLAPVIATHIIVKTKNLPDYKVIDISNATVNPFAKNVMPAPAPAANATATNTTTKRRQTAAASAPLCFNVGTVTYNQLVHNPDVTCFFGCDILLVVTDAAKKQVGVIQTKGFDTEELNLSKAAIGLIVGLVVGILVLCSCIFGIVYLCKKKGDHQQLQETR